ncbi:MAG TPA: DUF4347 domain-containing protein [Polyangiaceae bacterium]|nr:DUF4347 domain-containing protein [Polyangiaceae bacterium]
MADALRLVVYDATQASRPPRALGWSWRYGTQLYRALGRVDAAYGARSFSDALAWLGRCQPAQPIQELQFWGHGKWGRIFIDAEMLDRAVLEPGHAHHRAFQTVRERLSPDALLWFRTCETLGAQAGHDFARALGDATGARVAGHTYVIGYFQSGLHCARPGVAPSWPVTEGLARGSADAPERALSSSPSAPNTVTCLSGSIPDGW